MTHALLVPVQIEVSRNVRVRRRGGDLLRRRFDWVDGYKIVVDGKELQPYMRKRDAVAFCKKQGWTYSLPAGKGT